MWRRIGQALAEGRLVYRLILAVDVERYSRRDAQRQLQVQTDLRGVLDACAIDVGLDPHLWHRQVSGDGELLVLPEDTNITLVVGTLTREFERALAGLNQGRAPEDRLRVRLAMHHGTMILGPLGPAGEAPVVVSRLLDATPFRRFLQSQRHRDVALIVSDSLYRDIVCTGFCPLNPAEFQPMRVVVKGAAYRGYIYGGSGDAISVAISANASRRGDRRTDTAASRPTVFSWVLLALGLPAANGHGTIDRPRHRIADRPRDLEHRPRHAGSNPTAMTRSRSASD